jgi:sensor histidine kinase regulating citrate/malate metabolism
MIRVFVKKSKQETGNLFNLLMAVMPIQSIIICSIVYGYSVDIKMLQTPTLGIVAVTISLLLVFIFMIVLNNQRKALAYKAEYELAQERLKLQIEHYQQLYKEQREVKLIRHDIKNNLDAVYGLLKAECLQDALECISRIRSDVQKTAEIVNTQLPPVDAVLTAKISKAHEHGINIKYKVLLCENLYIDQFDLAVIIANALDNAIEGILRSCDVEKTVFLNIAHAAEYISIIVENSASSPIDDNFKTSKPDKANHGFGISQMKSVAKKYSGDIQPSFSVNTGLFTLEILLKNRPA